jgi:hypothetical protein
VFVSRINGDQTGALTVFVRAGAAFLLSFLSLSNANAYSVQTSFEPSAYIQNLFTPSDYDSNDNVQLVAEWFLSDSCGKLSSVNSAIDLKTRTLRLDFELTKSDGECKSGKSQSNSFETVINVGQVPAGTYIITQGIDDEVIGELKIRQAISADVDDQLFAEVSVVDFKSEMMGSHLSIRGHYSSTCETLSDIDLKVENNIITVKPIVSIDGANCAPVSIPFEANTALDFISLGRYLLQVRSKNGQAVNQLVDVN